MTPSEGVGADEADETDSAASDMHAEPSPRESLREGFSQAARNAGIGRVAPGEVPTISSLLAAIGGVRGLVESILPGFGFLLAYTITQELLFSVLVPVGVALAFVVARAIGRTTMMPAVAGLIGIGISATLALFTGRAEDNFVVGLIINVVSVLVLLTSILVRWPLIGVIVGLLTNELTEWRDDRAKRGVLALATWLWVGLFSARLLVQAPLYFSGQIEVLAAAKLLMGVPLYAAMLWVTWLLVRAVYSSTPRAENDASAR